MTTHSHAHTRTVAIISQKGGAGKTTLAIHLAAAATRSGRVSLLIDTDLQLRSASTAPQQALVERALIKLAMMARR